jgi:hypothetical protein
MRGVSELRTESEWAMMDYIIRLLQNGLDSGDPELRERFAELTEKFIDDYPRDIYWDGLDTIVVELRGEG